MAAAESYLRVQTARQSAEAAMRGIGGLHGDAAYALARTGEPAEAATAIERGRAVLLSDALSFPERPRDFPLGCSPTWS